jgi:hypothetical protein
MAKKYVLGASTPPKNARHATTKRSCSPSYWPKVYWPKVSSPTPRQQVDVPL